MIKFKDLSGALKTAVIISYVVGSFYAAAVLIGFIAGVTGY